MQKVSTQSFIESLIRCEVFLIVLRESQIWRVHGLNFVVSLLPSHRTVLLVKPNSTMGVRQLHADVRV